MRAQINETEKKSIKPKASSFKTKINKIDKSLALATLTNQKRERFKNNSTHVYSTIQMKWTNFSKITHTQNALKKKGDSLISLPLKILNWQLENLSPQAKNKQKTKSQSPDSFTGKFYQTSKEEIRPILQSLLENVREGNTS